MKSISSQHCAHGASWVPIRSRHERQTGALSGEPGLMRGGLAVTGPKSVRASLFQLQTPLCVTCCDLIGIACQAFNLSYLNGRPHE